MNGDSASRLTSTLQFTYYKDANFGIARIYPLGGPIQGGTRIHVYLIDDRLLVDLGGTAHGPACRFAYTERSATTYVIEEHVTLVRANLTDCAGSRTCGGGHGSLTCVVPPYTSSTTVDGAADVSVEVTINGQHYTSSGLSIRQYDPSAWRVLSLAPRGGPLSGNTSVVLRSELLQPLGDVRCRFGDVAEAEVLARLDAGVADVDATIDQSTSLVACVSPSHWRQGQGAQHVEIALTLNGQDYFSLWQEAIFTFYPNGKPSHGLSVQELTPNGGPSAGGTLVTVRGTGFVNFGGVLCLFEGEPKVPAFQDAQPDFIACTTPSAFVLQSPTSELRSLEVTLNGQTCAASTSMIAFRYYNASALSIARIYPLGGPIQGGTRIHVYLIDDRLLVDLGGTAHGPACRFAYTERSATTYVIEEHVTLVRANLTDCAGSRTCGGGHGSLTCVVPPYTSSTTVDGAADVSVEVTINGQHYTSSGLSIRQYDPSAWRVLSLAPRGGPLSGNTSVVLRSELLQPLGDVRCRFGDAYNEEVHASLDEAASVVSCVSPPHWQQGALYGTQEVEVELTLNGQDYLSAGMQGAFTYYDVDRPPERTAPDAGAYAGGTSARWRHHGRSVRHLTPNGGPSAGGTLVTVRGTGFVNFGGVLCLFEGEAPVNATLVNEEELRCRSPPMTPATAFETRALEVTLNGQRRARTSSGVPFTYFDSASNVRVSSIYPRGGRSVGGTLVTVLGRGFRDLDHGRGLKCAFGEAPLVHARLVGDSDTRLTCQSPPATDAAAVGVCTDQMTVVPLRITLNGNNSIAPPESNVDSTSWALTQDDVTFSYHD